MQADVSQFPIVWLWFKVPALDPDVPPFAGFEKLLSRKQPFVLINDEGLDMASPHEHSHEERKQTTLWMKRHKEALRTYVKGAIHIESDAAKRLAAEPFATESIKFWGYPMHLVGSQDEAMNLARTLLDL
ncbi:hypothetical protein HK11_08940 [Acetobacter sp. DmW_043]|uniref:hypothetical protein n=1 Tax=Acetobacter sp. DmW_043 TaxID=1670658 RepID=UPI000A3B717D|nr:hypothetical protein [Acetobacter sp. DmW_043]OUI87898.1 hypothetical protein HK11_08940 [Acetobacter sp. DmW_043]